MVKVRADRPVTDDGSVDLDQWIDVLAARLPLRDPERVRAAAELARQAELDAIADRNLWASGISSFETGLEMAEILVDLRGDDDALVAALLYRAVREGKLDLGTVDERFGGAVSGIIDGVLRMAAVSALKLSGVPKALGDTEAQVENIRKMLVALVDDVRVALVKLAERACAIRSVKTASAERRERVAREVFDVYAPLAHRLGIGQLRWELEDLSFRYLQPDAYKRIASLLQERREARQGFVDEVMDVLTRELAGAGIRAQVTGRPKHIYSIWRKMQAKGVGFDQVYDVHAVRILVEAVPDCYGALGVVHGLWRHIPHEFDDYVTMPKENGYRSIHTAVIGPSGRTLEVQIRTQEMHEEAELGVCAHWLYKGGVRETDASYEQKVAWLRQVLEWQEELGDLGSLSEQLRADFSDARIYVLTPDGHVVDLAPGATPLDYAYRIHTEVGHRCRAARVDGRVVALDHALATGEKVEIITDENAEPSPAWLNPNLGFVRTSRARAKIQSWFRARDRERNVEDGRRLVERELARMALDARLVGRIAIALGFGATEDLYGAVGSGELRPSRVLRAAQAIATGNSGTSQLSLLPFQQVASRVSQRPQVIGAGELPVWIADCCRPEAGDAIVGHVAVGHGVAVHRADCVRALELERSEEGRLIQLRWGAPSTAHTPFDLVISAWNRAGLLRDVTDVFAAEQIDVLASSSVTDRANSTAVIEVTVELDGLESLGRIMDRIGQIPNVHDVRRSAPET
jgi:GTP pyrophosphokinase